MKHIYKLSRLRSYQRPGLIQRLGSALRTKHRLRPVLISAGVIILSVSAFFIVAHYRSDHPPLVPALSNEVPYVKQTPSSAVTGWTSYAYVRDGFRLLLPQDWVHQTVSSGDPDDGYYVLFGPKSAAADADPRNLPGLMAVSSTVAGQGTPGNLRQQTKAPVAGQTADRLVWESDTTRLVQYRFFRSSQYFLVQFSGPLTDEAGFQLFEKVVQQLRFSQ